MLNAFKSQLDFLRRHLFEEALLWGLYARVGVYLAYSTQG